jgi:hypothetical protein
MVGACCDKLLLLLLLASAAEGRFATNSRELAAPLVRCSL